MQDQHDKIDFFTMMKAAALATLLAKHNLQEHFQKPLRYIVNLINFVVKNKKKNLKRNISWYWL